MRTALELQKDRHTPHGKVGWMAHRDCAGQQPFRQDLNVRLMCKNCKIDPPNIVEETANGDLVSGGLGWKDRFVVRG